MDNADHTNRKLCWAGASQAFFRYDTHKDLRPVFAWHCSPIWLNCKGAKPDFNDCLFITTRNRERGALDVGCATKTHLDLCWCHTKRRVGGQGQLFFWNGNFWFCNLQPSQIILFSLCHTKGRIGRVPSTNPFLSPPVQVARWAPMRHFPSVCDKNSYYVINHSWKGIAGRQMKTNSQNNSFNPEYME